MASAGSPDGGTADAKPTVATVRLPLGRVSYLHAGAAGAPVVLLHGYGDDARVWYRQAEGLAPVARVFALDFLGSGQSDAPAIDYTATLFVDTVCQFLDALQLGAVALVGADLGAAAALALAHRHPRRVQRLALLAPTLPGVPPGGRALHTVFSLVHRRGGQQLLRAVVPWLLRRWSRERVAARQIVGDGAPRRLAAPQLHAFASTARQWGAWLNERPRFGELQVPLLVLWGEADLIHPIREATLLQTIAPQTQLVRLPGCGHVPHLEQPELVNRCLREFLATPVAARHDGE